MKIKRLILSATVIERRDILMWILILRQGSSSFHQWRNKNGSGSISESFIRNSAFIVGKKKEMTSLNLPQWPNCGRHSWLYWLRDSNKKTSYNTIDNLDIFQLPISWQCQKHRIHRLHTNWNTSTIKKKKKNQKTNVNQNFLHLSKICPY